MAGKDVYLNFGADTGGLEASLARAQSMVRATTREMTTLAGQMQKTGATADSELGQKLAALGEKLGQAKGAASAARDALGAIGGATTKATQAVEAHGKAHGFNSMQMMESIHVAKAFIDEIVAGQNPLRALAMEGGRIAQILSMGISPTVGIWAAVGGAVLAAAGAMAYLVYQAHEFGVTSERLRTTAATGGLALSPGKADEITRELAKISGLSWDEAQKVAGAFGFMQTRSAEVFSAIAKDIAGFAKFTGEKPAEAAKTLVGMFDNPKLSAEELGKTVGKLSDEQRNLYERSLAAASPLERQAALQTILAQKIAEATKKTLEDKHAQLAAAEARKSVDEAEIARHGKRAGYARDDIEFTNNTIAALKQEIAAIKSANDEAAKMPDLIRESASAAELLRAKFDEVLKSASGAREAIKTSSEIDVLRAGLQGATGDAAALLRKFEGFQEVAKWDVNHFRAGYGSDTKTSASGAVSPVVQGDIVSREDAERDLARRLADVQAGLESKLGASWAALSDKAKASLTSISYNYGQHGYLPDNVLSVARGGNEKAIADAIAARAGDNGGKNAGRRAQEAANITREYAAVTDPEKVKAGSDALAEQTDKQRQLNEAKNGGGEVARAEMQNLQEEAIARADAVKQAERIVAARKAELDKTLSVEERAKAENALASAKADLLHKQNAETESGLRLDAARAKSTNNPAAEKAADLALVDFKIKIAGADVAAREAAEAEKVAVVQRYAEQDKQLAFQSAQERIAAAQRETQYALRDLELMLKARQITETQKLALTSQAYAKERAAVLAAYQSELQIENLRPKERKRILAEIEAAEKEASQRSKQVQLEAADASARAWLAGADKVAGVIDGQVDGVLRGATSMKQAFANMGASVIEDIVKLGIRWAAQQSAMTAATLTATATQTAAVGAGVAAQKAMNMTTVQGDAGRAAAGAYAAVAGIPLIGPILAPAAAAVAYAGTMAFASADIGMYDVPHDQLALIHKNELIMPARQAGALRDMLSGAPVAGGGGAGGAPVNVTPTTHFHVNAIDGASVSQFWRDNQQGMMRAIDEAVRHGAHLGMRRIAAT